MGEEKATLKENKKEVRLGGGEPSISAGRGEQKEA